jgi:hypothetical protein
VERLWFTRLRWRLRGAWLWPSFFGLSLLDGILIHVLPPYAGTPPGLVGGLLLAGFANLALVAGVAPLLGRGLRRHRPDLPRAIATDYAGTALIVALALTVLIAGLAHRPAVAAERGDEAAMRAAVSGYVDREAPGWRPGLGALDSLRLEPRSYRACVPGADPGRWLCLIVDTDRRPPAVVRDGSMEPNSRLRAAGGFR